MRIKHLLSLLAFCTFVQMTSAQIYISEVRPDLGEVEIYNAGGSMEDISTFQLCDFPAYEQLSALDVVCGDPDFLIGAGEYLVVEGFFMSPADGECGLYSSTSWSSSLAIVDYVEWGSTGHTRSSTAVAGGVWTTGAFAPAMTAGQSIGVDGNGYEAENWMLFETPTICEPNVAGDDCEGGMVTYADESTSTTICSMDGETDVLEFMTTSESSSSYQWVITDTDGNVLGLPEGNSNDFNDAPAGTCLIWGLSYSGELLLEVDDNVEDAELASGCAEFSSNSLTVVRQYVSAGDVSLADGSDLAYACFGDNETLYSFINTSEADADYVYVVVENGIILEVMDGDENNFGFMAEATCSIYGISYTGDFLLGNGQELFTNDVSTGCWDISETFAVVVTHTPNGGEVTFDNDQEVADVCPGTEITFETTSTSNLAYVFVVTDEDNNVIEALEGSTYDFADYDAGTYYVYGLSYANEFLLEAGDDIETIEPADQCFEWSSTDVEINLYDVDGGEVTTADGESEIEFCTSDGGSDLYDFITTEDSDADYLYIITDEDGMVLGLPGDNFDFGEAPAGVCHVYGYSYLGDVLIEDGQNIFDDPISSECGELSSTWITVTRHVVNGASVETTDGETSVTIDIDDNADVIEFQNDTDSDEEYSYVVTDDNGVILTILDGNSNDFNEADPGTCYVYGVSHWMDLTYIEGETIDDLASFGCHDVSENFVTIIRQIIDNVSEVENASISVFPNPTNDILNLSSNWDEGQYQLIDQTGRVVASGTLQGVSTSIDVSAFAKGLYLLNVANSNQMISTKVAID